MLRSMLRARQPICLALGGTLGDILWAQIADWERTRRRRWNPTWDEFFVQVPESSVWLDTASMPAVLTAVAVALFAKLLMMNDESKAQQRLEHKIQKAPPEQGTVQMLTHEEWDEIQEISPRMPFELKLACPNALLRTGEEIRRSHVNDWSIDVLTDALTRAEESAKQR